MLLQVILLQESEFICTTYIIDVANNCHIATHNTYMYEKCLLQQYVQTPISMTFNSSTLIWFISDLSHISLNGCIVSVISHPVKPASVGVKM